jgi:mRNA interferase MazF
MVTPTPSQGEIWWAEAEDKRRPVLVVTRSEAVPVLTWIVVAPVTRTIRGIPTEVALGPEQGLPDECVASFDNLQPVRRSFLVERVGELDADERAAICEAVRALTDC